MKISELSQQTKVSIRMIRYYEEQGLLKPTRTHSGYRNFKKDDIELINKIRLFKEIGFTIEDIRPILHCQLTQISQQEICDQLKHKFSCQIEQIDQMIANLNQAKITLRQYL
ncbi:MerR family transcriptional regulator [Vibrio sp. CAIM 722]|uniref:MerR family transcriptional regulator n=1 Tax=Vibrio eleionomae TaxID=2653505 RepID=A0A7X4LJC3_9VIBR|nr:MerR family transcriptional regulator [Vibrio eleionomae]MZI93013.1 MerR family transcriptional regulator [Vibrio eleionomae]